MSTPSVSSVSPLSVAELLVECPECAASVRLAHQPLAGEVVRCGECRAELEITGVSPLRVELAPEVEEDWGE